MTASKQPESHIAIVAKAIAREKAEGRKAFVLVTSEEEKASLAALFSADMADAYHAYVLDEDQQGRIKPLTESLGQLAAYIDEMGPGFPILSLHENHRDHDLFRAFYACRYPGFEPAVAHLEPADVKRFLRMTSEQQWAMATELVRKQREEKGSPPDVPA